MVLEMPCPNCGAVNQAGANFCLGCGYSFSGRKSAAMGGHDWRETMNNTGWGMREGTSFGGGGGFRNRGQKGFQPLEPRGPQVDINTLGTSAYGHLSDRTQIYNTGANAAASSSVHLW